MSSREDFKVRLKSKVEKLKFQLSSKNSFLLIAYYKYFVIYKKGSLGDFLNKLSKENKKTFSVIQIGANDGFSGDPISMFIKKDKWKGVLVEPQKYVYDNFLTKVYKKNKGVHTICAAIGSKSETQKLYKIGFSNMRWATGLASFQKDTIEKAFDDGYIQECCEKYNIQMPVDLNERIVSQDVTIISPDDLIKKYNIESIDLLQIDTEGYDFEVIKMFDIPKLSPKAIVFEHKHLKQRDTEACYSHLKEYNYKLKKIGSDTVAVKNPSSSRLIKFFE